MRSRHLYNHMWVIIQTSHTHLFSAGQSLELWAQQWMCREWVMQQEGYCYEERRVYSPSNLIFAQQANSARCKGLSYSPLLLSHTLSQAYVSTTLPVPQPAAGAPALQVSSPPCCARTGGRKSCSWQKFSGHLCLQKSSLQKRWESSWESLRILVNSKLLQHEI